MATETAIEKTEEIGKAEGIKTECDCGWKRPKSFEIVAPVGIGDLLVYFNCPQCDKYQGVKFGMPKVPREVWQALSKGQTRDSDRVCVSCGHTREIQVIAVSGGSYWACAGCGLPCGALTKLG